MRFFVLFMMLVLAMLSVALAGKHAEADGESMKVHKVKHMKGEADGESVKHFKKGKMHGEA